MPLVCDLYAQTTRPADEDETGLPRGYFKYDAGDGLGTGITQNFLNGLIDASTNVENVIRVLTGETPGEGAVDFSAALLPYTTQRERGQYVASTDLSHATTGGAPTWTRINFDTAEIANRSGLAGTVNAGSRWRYKALRNMTLSVAVTLGLQASTASAGLTNLRAGLFSTDGTGAITGFICPIGQASMAGNDRNITLHGSAMISLAENASFCILASMDPIVGGSGIFGSLDSEAGIDADPTGIYKVAACRISFHEV